MTFPRPRCVFLDAQPFIASNFSVTDSPFSELVDAFKKGHVRVFMNEVTIGEIKANIREAVAAAATAAKRFRSEGRALQNLSDKGMKSMWKRVDVGSAVKQITSQFDEFLRKAHVETIDCSEVDTAEVFEWYFKGLAPFGSGNKKAEFPDAFVIASAAEWLRKNPEETGCLISGDADWESACARLRLSHCRSIAEFLDPLTRKFEAERSEFALTLLQDNEDDVKAAITAEVSDIGFYLSDEDGDVEDVRVESTSLTDPLLLEVDESSASFEISVTANVEADISYDDPEMTVYDHEDDRKMVFGTIEETVERELTFTAEIELFFDPEDGRLESAECSRLNHGKPIFISPYVTRYDLK